MTLVTNTGKNVNDLSRLGLVASSVVDVLESVRFII